MSMPTRWSLPSVVTLMTVALLITLPSMAAAQNVDSVRLNRKLKNLLVSQDNITGLRGLRFANVSIFKLNAELTERLRRFLSKDDASDSAQVCATASTWLDDEKSCQEIFTAVSGAVGPLDPRRFGDQIRQTLAIRLGLTDKDDIDVNEFNSVIATYQSLKNRAAARPNSFYLVTSRDSKNPRLIGLLGFTTSGGSMTLSGQQFVWVGNDLFTWLGSNQDYNGMYADMRDAIVNENRDVLQNVTYAIRDIDDVRFVTGTKAHPTMIDENTYDWVLTGISDGRPLRKKATSDSGASNGGSNPFGGGSFQMAGVNTSGSPFTNAEVPGTGEYPYELAIGSDVLASFRAYELTNDNQPHPKWGFEVRNNFDEINYPSIWGGRMTVSAVLENIKIGAILPSFRFGETIGESGIGSNPQNIVGGYGAAMSGDFAFPLMDNSGLFTFYTSYTFSESSTDKMLAQKDVFHINPDSTLSAAFNGETGETGYLMRYAALGYYSFGFYADKDAQHMFRIKVGGGAYGVDTYKRQIDISDTLAFIEALNTETSEGQPDTLRTYYKSSNSVESRGGVAARIEYMRGGTKYPFGAAIQYFDGSLLSNVWLQFAVGEQFDLKLEGKFFTPIFREPRLWESESLVVPSLTVKYHF